MIDVMTLAAAKAICGGGATAYYSTDPEGDYADPGMIVDLVDAGKPFILEAPCRIGSNTDTIYFYTGNFSENYDGDVFASAHLMRDSNLYCICLFGSTETNEWATTVRKVTSSAV